MKTFLMKHWWLVHELFLEVMLLRWVPGKKMKWSIFFLISAQACLFCRRPGVLPRRQISKSSMPIMNKSFTHLKEWNLFSVVWMKVPDKRSNCWLSPTLKSWEKGPSFIPCPFSRALSWLLRCVTLGMSVNFSICCIIRQVLTMELLPWSSYHGVLGWLQ